jgi:hypothetical protein
MSMASTLFSSLTAAATILGLTAPAAGASLGSDVLAQVIQSGGYAEKPDNFSVRVLQDGTIEELVGSKWQRIGRLTLPTVRRFKRVTDVMTPKNRLLTEDSRVADSSSIEYLVRNGDGETVVIGRKGPTNALLLQGGATSIVQVLDGLRTLVRISY